MFVALQPSLTVLLGLELVGWAELLGLECVSMVSNFAFHVASSWCRSFNCSAPKRCCRATMYISAKPFSQIQITPTKQIILVPFHDKKWVWLVCSWDSKGLDVSWLSLFFFLFRWRGNCSDLRCLIITLDMALPWDVFAFCLVPVLMASSIIELSTLLGVHFAAGWRHMGQSRLCWLHCSAQSLQRLCPQHVSKTGCRNVSLQTGQHTKEDLQQ